MNRQNNISEFMFFTFHTKIPLAVGRGRKRLPSFNIV